MFMYELREGYLGPKLIAAAEVWVDLRNTVSDVANRSPLLKCGDDGNDFQGLAYAARHTEEREGIGNRQAVELYWPTLLAQAALLRQSLAYLDHSKSDQAITYALESVIEKALKDDFGEKTEEIIKFWQTLDTSRFYDGSEFDRLREDYELNCSADERPDRLAYLLGYSAWMDAD